MDFLAFLKSQKFFFLFSFHLNRKDCKRCVVIYEKHENVLQYKESECELEQNKPASAAISSVIRSDYNTDSRFQGNEQYLDPESKCHIIFNSIFHYLDRKVFPFLTFFSNIPTSIW